MAKFSPTGTFLWGMGLLGDAHEEGRGVSVLPSGDVMLCGEFDGMEHERASRPDERGSGCTTHLTDKVLKLTGSPNRPREQSPR